MSIKQIIRWLVIAIIITALWKVSGGDLSGVLNSVWKFLTGIVGEASDWLVSTGIFQAIFK